MVCSMYIIKWGQLIHIFDVGTKITSTLRAAVNQLRTFSKEVSKTGSRGMVTTKNLLIMIECCSLGGSENKFKIRCIISPEVLTKLM